VLAPRPQADSQNFRYLGVHGLSARSTPFGFTSGRLVIARGHQFLLKLQPFVRRHGGLLALRRQIVDREIAVGLLRTSRSLSPRVHQ